MTGNAGVAHQLVSFFNEPPKKSGQIHALGVELLPMERTSEFTFDVPAVAGIVYVRHPTDHRQLIAFADYDERLAQERYEEALRVFTSLGAARIVATSLRQTVRTKGGKFALPGNAFSLDHKQEASVSLAFNQEGDGGRPIDPRPLRFRDIAGLEQVCEGVLRLGWKKGRIQIVRSSTLGVDGSLAIRLEKAGFELGLSGSKVIVTEFNIEAAYTKEAARELDAVVATTDLASAGNRKRRGPKR